MKYYAGEKSLDNCSFFSSYAMISSEIELFCSKRSVHILECYRQHTLVVKKPIVFVKKRTSIRKISLKMFLCMGKMIK